MIYNNEDAMITHVETGVQYYKLLLDWGHNMEEARKSEQATSKQASSSKQQKEESR